MSEEHSAVARTPLYDVHHALGARMRPFGGFEMPVQYSSIIEEHLAVRNEAGLFDVSHMGEFIVSGGGSEELVQRIATNDAGKLSPGRAMYTVMCTEEGGIVDDLLVYMLDDSRYMLVVNAANIEKDHSWLEEHNSMDAHIEDVSGETALMALQGPRSIEIAETATGLSLEDLKYYRFVSPTPDEFYGCERAVISATGYTGEKGFELYCDADKAEGIWRRILEIGESRGIKPAGLGARDTLRIEAGYCLYGSDITESTNPLEAGLGWLVKLDKGPFIGRDSLKKIHANGPSRKLIGFVLNERGIPRHDYEITDEDGARIGTVTSGTQSPVLEKGVGMGYVLNEPDYCEEGRRINIEIRRRNVDATVKSFPLHKHSG